MVQRIGSSKLRTVSKTSIHGVLPFCSRISTGQRRLAELLVKFRYTTATTDFNVLVAEDNDGGHELELGEATLSETYVAERDYRHASVNKDLEYEKYDAMIGTLFKLMDRRGHLFK